MFLFEIFAFHFQPIAFASSALWSLGLYLGLSKLGDWLMVQLARWFNYAERSLYTSSEEFERTRPAREAQNAFYASLVSVVPFLIIGTICHVLANWSLGQSWSVSLGALVAIGSAIYELGRRTDGTEN
jgi:hypothetical protein